MKSIEEVQLSPTNLLLDRAAQEIAPTQELNDARLIVLEAAASILGGWDLQEYWESFHHKKTEIVADPLVWANKILDSMAATPIPTALALSALSREVIPSGQRRKTGAYYTDWRLAQQLASQSVPNVQTDGPWIDTACGSGVLLAASVMEIPAGEQRDEIIRDRLVGADLSARALRGALLSVASLTSDLSAVSGFAGRLLQQDSLTSRKTWTSLVPAGAALIIGNPPWEKLKVSRHEFAAELGQVRHYGQSYEENVDLSQHQANLLTYIDAVATGTQLQGKGEHDLYKLFLELGIGLAAENGVLALLLPAGLIRAQGTEALRHELSRCAQDLSISVMENRARHFAIDSRFKFVSVVARVGANGHTPISLKVAGRTGKLPADPVYLPRDDLKTIRPDLSIPEVKSNEEWTIFSRLAGAAYAVGDPSGPWQPEYRREVDMSLEKQKFTRTPDRDSLPLIEGRHVSHYRWRAKTYESGEGRAAIWRPEPIETAKLRTQWFIPEKSLHVATAGRQARSRLGFCDITGQTNERSLMVARIPSGVVCGNKVPTLTFPEGGAAREDLFLALCNSFAVDWMMRRLVTTSVNFFLLNTLPLPEIYENSEIGTEIISLARRVSVAEGDPRTDRWELGRWRARIDALVAFAWGLSLDDMEVIFRDFPLLDRGQPSPRPGMTATITKDSVLAELANLYGIHHSSTELLRYGQDLGSIPYIPAEYV